MTNLLEKAFNEATKLNPEEQDALAAWILDELESEKHWQQSLSRSAGFLEGLAEEALKDFQNGQTDPLDPEKI